MKTLDDWLDYIFSQKQTGYGLPLTRVAPYFKAFNLDNTIAPVIISVTGTNGKGSTLRLLEEIYLAAGLRVVAMTSPHLVDFCERLTLDGKPVEVFCLLDAFAKVKAEQGDTVINAFDFFTIALLLCAKDFKPDVLLLEVGVGGRLDVVNMFDAKAAVITTIDLDHAELLGPTREHVAFEKVQLARTGCPLICGEVDAPQIIRQVAEQKGATLYQNGSSNKGFFYHAKTTTWDWFGPGKSYKDLPIPKIKLQNAATALMTLESLQDSLPIAECAIRQGLERALLPGRFEVIKRQCPIILDVAHNPQACAQLAEALNRLPVVGTTFMVFGMATKKALHQSLRYFIGNGWHWYVAAFKQRESYSPLRIKQELEALGEKNCYTNEDFAHALQMAFQQAGPNDRIVVFGSFLAVAEAKRQLGDELCKQN